MKSALAALALAAALLTGCGKDAETPAPASVATPAPAPGADLPAAAPSPDTSATSATPDAVDAVDAAKATSAETPVATPAPATEEPIAETTPTPAPVAVSEVVPPRGPAPVEGTDYTLIDPPAPMAPASGKIEVAEVFAYYCIHCATMEKLVTAWKATLPTDVDFKQVPTAHGQAEPFARAFYAAEAMGILEATHPVMFDNIAVKRLVKTGQLDEIAQLYGPLGHDPATMLSTMNSFAVNAQIARAQKAVTRWAIEVTPSFIVAGKYRVTSTTRGHQGVLDVVEHLVARERAAMGTNPAP